MSVAGLPQGGAEEAQAHLTLRALVSRAADGDAQGWRGLIDRYAQLIWSIIKEYKLTEREAADAAQATWMCLLEHVIARLAVPDRLDTWVAGTAEDQCRDRLPARRTATVSQRLTNMAVFLAGRNRPGIRAEWQAHLAGESGHDPVTGRKLREALGFVAAALKCRLSDAADVAWAPVDAVLKSRTLSNIFVFGPPAVVALFIRSAEGILGVVKSAESVSAIGAVLYGLVQLGRWWRDVKPRDPKARRAKE